MPWWGTRWHNNVGQWQGDHKTRTHHNNMPTTYNEKDTLQLVFAGSVCSTEKMTRTELNPTAKDWTTGCSCTNSKIFSCQLEGLLKNQKTEKSQSRLVSTGLLSHHILDLTHTHIYLIFGPWIIKKQTRIGWDMAKNIFICISNVCPFCFCHMSAKY